MFVPNDQYICRIGSGIYYQNQCWPTSPGHVRHIRPQSVNLYDISLEAGIVKKYISTESVLLWLEPRYLHDGIMLVNI